MRTIVLGIVLPLGLAAGVLGGIVSLGAAATQDLRRQGQGVLAFSDLRCDVPAPLSRAEFLREVQYEAGVPDQFDLLAPGWQDRLRAAFRRSAWVEDVLSVRIASRGTVRVELRMRKAVLAVATTEGLRAVDREQVLLPRAVPVDGLPVLRWADAIAAVPTGSVLHDPEVSAAVQTITSLSPTLSSQLAAVEIDGEDVILWTSAGKRIVRGPMPREPLLLARAAGRE